VSALSWAWEQELPQTPKVVLACLSDLANSKPDFTCWAKVKTIAR
jgi:hypothetical protein